jgi:hypothetical protein
MPVVEDREMLAEEKVENQSARRDCWMIVYVEESHGI